MPWWKRLLKFLGLAAKDIAIDAAKKKLDKMSNHPAAGPGNNPETRFPGVK